MHKRGFTLIELILVLSLMSVLVSLSLTWAFRFYTDADDEMVKSQLLQALEMAQQQASIRHVPVVLCSSKNHTTCTNNWKDGLIMFVNESKDGIVRHEEDMVSIMQFHQSPGVLYWRSFPHYRAYLLFLPSGLLRTDNSMFWYCRDSKIVWAVALAKSGRLRVLTPDVDGYIRDAHSHPLQCKTTNMLPQNQNL